jgi:hypothetical protein
MEGLFQKILRERAAHRERAETMPPETRRFNARTGARFVIVSPSCLNPGEWRATLFDDQGPVCHTETRDHAAAVIAARDYGADILTPVSE